MAHEIETYGDQAAAVFARTDAWHRLGTTVRDRAFTAEEAMTLGHLGGCYAGELVMPSRVRPPPQTMTPSRGGVLEEGPSAGERWSPDKQQAVV